MLEGVQTILHELELLVFLVGRNDLMTIEAEDIRASRVFSQAEDDEH